MSTVLVLALALGLDAIFGEPRLLWERVPHPAILMGRLVGWCDAKMNFGENRIAKGGIALLLLVLCAGVVGWVLSFFGGVVAVCVVAVLLAHKSLVQHVTAVATALRYSTEEGQRAVSMIVSRDTSHMDDSAVARSAIESAAENYSDGVIAPAFWFLVAGLPGILIYKVVNTADSMIGYRTEKYEEFGKAAARLDDLLNWVPARLTALMLALVGGAVSKWKDIANDASMHKSPNAGWPEAALSRGLGIAVAGPRMYHGTLQDFAWVNPMGRKTLKVNDIEATVGMLWKTSVILMAALIAAALVL
ncbi:MAG: cobalamin biosynthesis protein [Rhodobacteraceae bacterium]|nr:cobalamin biosynthesis protein [Paracoccaceae bacterium]